MGVEQHQPLKSHGSQLHADAFQQLNQHVRREAERAWKISMLRRKTNRLNRQTPDRSIRWQAMQHCIKDALGEQGVRDQGQLGPVLFAGPKRPDHG